MRSVVVFVRRSIAVLTAPLYLAAVVLVALAGWLWLCIKAIGEVVHELRTAPSDPTSYRAPFRWWLQLWRGERPS